MSQTAGVFGKLPFLGDFVHRGFSNQLVNALDQLVKTAIQAAISKGASKHSLEQSSHTCMIYIRPGSVTQSGYVGCMIPSCDKVGRFYPIFAGYELAWDDQFQNRSTGSWVSIELAVELCRVVFRAQSLGLAPDDLVSQLPAASSWMNRLSESPLFFEDMDTTLPVAVQNTLSVAFVGPESKMDHLDRALCSRLSEIVPIFGSVLTEATHFDYFFTLCHVDECNKLAALFDGQWSQWGWHMHPVESADHPDEDCTLPPPLSDDSETLY